MICTLLQDLF